MFEFVFIYFEDTLGKKTEFKDCVHFLIPRSPHPYFIFLVPFFAIFIRLRRNNRQFFLQFVYQCANNGCCVMLRAA